MAILRKLLGSDALPLFLKIGTILASLQVLGGSLSIAVTFRNFVSRSIPCVPKCLMSYNGR
jgi:hypothetical protein